MADDVRKGQDPGKLGRQGFRERFVERFVDPAYDAEREAIARLEHIAWDGYVEGRKAPRRRLAGAGFADPTYELSVDWLKTRDAIAEAAAKQADRGGSTRVLVVSGSTRTDGTCPGEMAKTYRLAKLAEEALVAADVVVDLLDLSRVSREPHLHIHPCKACVSTAMPLCHWPCTCYPNHATGQDNDWMNELYPRWVAAHGVLVITPVHWYQAPTVLKAMIDRLVCADGGNADPTTTHGKEAAEAKAIERAGWDFPKHLAGRAYGVVVHGDAEGTQTLRRILADWLTSMGLIQAGAKSSIDRYLGYYENYGDGHATLDRDEALQEEVRVAARAVARAANASKRGELVPPDAGLEAPRQK